MLIAPLLLTLLIESIVLFLFRQRDPIFYVYWTAVTTLTNIPANLWLSLTHFDSTAAFCLTVVAIELLVFIAELLLCLLYTKNLRTSIRYSAICNLASFGFGSLILAIL